LEKDVADHSTVARKIFSISSYRVVRRARKINYSALTEILVWDYAPRGLLINHGTLFVRCMKKGFGFDNGRRVGSVADKLGSDDVRTG
jgi:hypothetical protein